MITKEQAENWAKALESGEFTQCTGSLTERGARNKVIGHCCLGVLLVSMGICKKEASQDSVDYDDIHPMLGSDETTVRYYGYNDRLGKTFPEIAELVRAEFCQTAPSCQPTAATEV